MKAFVRQASDPVMLPRFVIAYRALELAVMHAEATFGGLSDSAPVAETLFNPSCYPTMLKASTLSKIFNSKPRGVTA
jgi:hypothetical protein